MTGGGWSKSFANLLSVTASDDFQEIDVAFSDIGGNDEDLVISDFGISRFVSISWGDMVGTVVVQKVQVIENTKGSETTIHAMKASKADDALYNLAGQRVDASYKGIVIQNGRKRMVR